MLKGLEQELQIEKPQTLKWLAIDEIAMLGEWECCYIVLVNDK